MTEKVDSMAPEASPGAVHSGVRRVNNLPMYILGGVVLAFLLVMALVAADRAAKQNAPAEGPKEKAGNTSMLAKEISGDKLGGLIEPALPLTVPNLPTGRDSVPSEIAGQEHLDASPTLPRPGDSPGPPTPNDEAQRIRTAKLQMFDEAVKAKTTVRFDPARSSGSVPGALSAIPDAPQTRDEMLARIAAVQQQIHAQRGTDPNGAYQARLAQIRGQGAGSGALGGGSGGIGAPQLSQSAATGSGRESFAQFGANGPGDRWRLDSQPEAPRSPHELRAGFVVPATLISGINSALPGQIIAQVSQDVYDTPTGKWKLIPQGSRLVGQYSSDVAYGQSRVLVAWQRIVFPDGKAMDIGSMPGADSAGYSGLSDKVDHHYVRIFGSALLMSGITAGVAITQNCDNQTSGAGTSGKCAMTEALGQQLGITTAALIAKNLNIAPTIDVRPGFRFNVIVTKDMTFSKPYRSFDY